MRTREEVMNDEKMERLVAAWESRGGKYRVELRKRPRSWNYLEYTDGRTRGFGYWPALGQGRDEQAKYGLVDFGRRLRAGHFQADNNKSPMRRVA